MADAGREEFLAEVAEAREVASLRAQIRARRGDECVVLELRRSRSNPLDDPRPALDALVAQLGFRPLGEHWREIDPKIAASLGAAVLSQALAFEHQILPAEVAVELADRFFRLFTEPRRCFTNAAEAAWPLERGLAAAWDPITARTYDTGVALVSSDQIGLLWAQEDD